MEAYGKLNIMLSCFLFRGFFAAFCHAVILSLVQYNSDNEHMSTCITKINCLVEAVSAFTV